MQLEYLVVLYFDRTADFGRFQLEAEHVFD